MTDDRRVTHPIDDDDVARLVREVAEGWVMPPLRLDEPTWRDRVRSPRTRRIEGLRTWLGRLGQAAAGAAVLTVAAALVAVVLVNPPDAGKSPEPTSGQSPRPSGAAQASQLPKLLVEGDLPTPSRFAVQVEDGDHAIVDLADGTLGAGLSAGQYGSQVRQLGDGTYVCFCVAMSGYAQGQYTNATVTRDRLDADGHAISRDTIVEITGAPDPRDGQVPEMPAHATAWTSFSADGTIAYVGWTAREHPVWHAGLVAVRVATGTVLQRMVFPDRSTGSGETRVVANAPRVVGSDGSGRVVIGEPWYSWTPPDSTNAVYHFASDVSTAEGLSAETLGAPRPLLSGGGCLGEVLLAGGLPFQGTWLACQRDGTVAVRRIDASGSITGESIIPMGAIEGDTIALGPDGSDLYVWHPQNLAVTRIELETGTVTTGHGSRASGALEGPLSALGHWLAPDTTAKVFLKSGIVVSPDGTRVYALGVRANSGRDVGSEGVFVFDAATLAPLARWQPTADFVSLAVSADGRFVYAAGAPGVDATGRETHQPASITVFDASDGSVRLIAGQLGGAFIAFNGSILE